MRSSLRQWGLAVLVCALASGCTLDVDIFADATANLGDPVNFKVKVTNRSNCPVSLVTAVIIPFVPKDLLISQIDNEELRDHLSDAVDEFCSGGEIEAAPNGVSGECVVDGGDLVCTVDLGEGVEVDVGTGETLVGLPAESAGVACSVVGGTITCRIAQALMQNAAETVEGQEQAPLNCAPVGPLVVCSALKLDPQEMEMDEFQLTAEATGIFRHFAVAFPQRAGGVCRTGVLAGEACEEDSQTHCPTLGTPDCAPGICSGGANDGNGCDPAVVAHCTGGTCTACGIPDNGPILTGIACDTTAVGNVAPAMSHWAYAATAVLLFGATLYLLRRRSERASG